MPLCWFGREVAHFISSDHFFFFFFFIHRNSIPRAISNEIYKNLYNDNFVNARLNIEI